MRSTRSRPPPSDATGGRTSERSRRSSTAGDGRAELGADDGGLARDVPEALAAGAAGDDRDQANQVERDAVDEPKDRSSGAGAGAICRDHANPERELPERPTAM